MVEKGMTCVKYLLFAFNLLFFLFGGVLIGVGAYVQIKLASYSDFTGGDVPINGAAIVLIVVGVVTFIVRFFGCCGAIKENHCMLITFAVLIGIILVCEIGAGIAGYVLRDDVKETITKGMRTSMDGYKEDTNIQDSWDKMQDELKCCGINGASDWVGKKVSIPKSCCAKKDATCTQANSYTGCLPKLENELKSNIGVVAGVAIGLAVVELIGIILACCLARSIRSEYEVA